MSRENASGKNKSTDHKIKQNAQEKKSKSGKPKTAHKTNNSPGCLGEIGRELAHCPTVI